MLIQPERNPKKAKSVWRLWCKTIGSKISDNDSEADKAAILRTVWVVVHLAACFAILANVVHHW